MQNETGLVSITGTPDAPCKAGISAADIAAGMYAFSGILLALHLREKTGRGTVLRVSLFDSLSEWMLPAGYYQADGGPPPARSGAEHASIAPYGPYSSGDGKQVSLGIQNEREWGPICSEAPKKPELAGDPRFNANSRRSDNRDALRAVIGEAFQVLALDQIVERLEQAGIAYGRMNSVREFWHHPQHSSRGRWRDVSSPAGTVPALLPPIDLQGIEPRMERIPALGEDTETILSEIGYNAEQIRELRSAGAV